MVKRDIGSERLLRDYLLLKVERKMLTLTVDLYKRLITALADRHYVEDSVLWNNFIYKYVFETERKD